MLGADQLEVRRPGGGAAGGPGVEHHAAVDVDQGGGDDPDVTQQRSEHDGDAVGPDVHQVAVATHEPPRSPLPQPEVDQRWPAVDGKNAWLSPLRPPGPDGCVMKNSCSMTRRSRRAIARFAWALFSAR